MGQLRVIKKPETSHYIAPEMYTGTEEEKLLQAISAACEQQNWAGEVWVLKDIQVFQSTVHYDISQE